MKTERKFLFQEAFDIYPEYIEDFINAILKTISSPAYNEMIINDSSGRLEITFEDNAMKIIADRGISNDIHSVGGLFSNLMSLSSKAVNN